MTSSCTSEFTEALGTVRRMDLGIIETEATDGCHAVMSAAIEQVNSGAEKSLSEDPENSMHSPYLYNMYYWSVGHKSLRILFTHL